jgi:hypothetical protein
MPYDMPFPEVKEFILEELDARMGIPTEKATKVTIRQATLRQNALRADLFAVYTTEPAQNDKERTRVIYNMPLYSLYQLEVQLTLVECNLTQNQKPLFRFKKSPSGSFLDMTDKEFAEAWGSLTDDIAFEIHGKVLEVNPHWIMGAGDSRLGEG